MSTHKSIALTAKARLFANEYITNNLPYLLRGRLIDDLNALNLKIDNQEMLDKFETTIKSICKSMIHDRKNELKLKRKVIRLEVHNYAPELNSLHTSIGVFRTPNIFKINEAITYLISKTQIKDLL